MSGRILSEPDLCLSLLVWAFAAGVFPLHLGWAGTSLVSLVAYIAIAAGMMLAAEGLRQLDHFAGWRTVPSEFLLRAIGLALPAFLAFTLGAAMAPAEEAFEDDLCRIGGFSLADDSANAEADDAFDLTADCLTRE